MRYRLFGLLLLCVSSYTQAELRVFACEPEWQRLTQALGGEWVDVYSATSAKQDPHHIQARPSLIAKARRADLLVCTGAELEIGWLPLLLRKSNNRRIQPNSLGWFMATDYVKLLGKPAVLDRSLGDVHAAGNPHIHLDPDRMWRVAKALSLRLQELDSEHVKEYQQLWQKFDRDWQSAIAIWREQAKSLSGLSVVTHHTSWLYFLRWLGVDQVATLEAKAGVAPSIADLKHLLQRISDTSIDGILYANYQSPKAANWLSNRIDAKALALPFSVADGESLTDWYSGLIQRLLALRS